jgi:hypothetical protein
MAALWRYERATTSKRCAARSAAHVVLEPQLTRKVALFGDETRRRVELRGVAAPSIPNLIVAWHAGDVRSPDPQALHEGSPSPQSRHMASQVTFRPIYAKIRRSELKINPLKIIKRVAHRRSKREVTTGEEILALILGSKDQLLRW